MGKRLLTAALSLMLLFFSTGCSSILEGETYEITPYFQTDSTAGSDTATEVTTYEEFKAAVSQMVKDHIESAAFRITTFDRENLEESLNEVCQELSSVDPLGSYVTYYISCQITPIVGYHDVTVNIVYKKSVSEIANITTVSSDRYLHMLLNSAMTDFTSVCAFYTDRDDITADYIRTVVREQYYSDPLNFIIPPEISVTSYPAQDGDRIMEVTFTFNNYTSAVLSNMRNDLNEEIQDIISGLPDSDNHDLVKALYEYMLFYSYVNYNATRLTSTAYNVIINRIGNSEGFAMAFKALCDKVNIDCQVVNGKYMGEDHYWNIVTFGGSSYHIDIPSGKNGEPAFLRGDEYMKENYWWDTSTAPECLADYSDFTEIAVDEPVA